MSTAGDPNEEGISVEETAEERRIQKRKYLTIGEESENNTSSKKIATKQNDFKPKDKAIASRKGSNTRVASPNELPLQNGSAFEAMRVFFPEANDSDILEALEWAKGDPVKAKTLLEDKLATRLMHVCGRTRLDCLLALTKTKWNIDAAADKMTHNTTTNERIHDAMVDEMTDEPSTLIGNKAGWEKPYQGKAGRPTSLSDKVDYLEKMLPTYGLSKSELWDRLMKAGLSVDQAFKDVTGTWPQKQSEKETIERTYDDRPRRGIGADTEEEKGCDSSRYTISETDPLSFNKQVSTSETGPLSFNEQVELLILTTRCSRARCATVLSELKDPNRAFERLENEGGPNEGAEEDEEDDY